MRTVALPAESEVTNVGTGEQQAAKRVEPCTCVHRDRLFGQVAGTGIAMRRVRDCLGMCRVMHPLLDECENQNREP